MIGYEWAAEHADEYGDIQEVMFVDKLSELSRDWHEPLTGCVKVDICLRRYDFSESEGIQDTEYFYPDSDGKLVLFDLEFKHEWTAIKSKQKEYDNFVKRSSCNVSN